MNPNPLCPTCKGTHMDLCGGCWGRSPLRRGANADELKAARAIYLSDTGGRDEPTDWGDEMGRCLRQARAAIAAIEAMRAHAITQE